jgi:hypothetical protein
MADGSESGDANDGSEDPHALVPRPLTDESDVATDLVRDAVRVARGELSDKEFHRKYQAILGDDVTSNDSTPDR